MPFLMAATISASEIATRLGTTRISGVVFTGWVGTAGRVGTGETGGAGTTAVGGGTYAGGGGTGAAGEGRLTAGGGVPLTAEGALLRFDRIITPTISPQMSANAPAAHKIQFPSRAAICLKLSPSEPISSMTTGTLVPQVGHMTMPTPSGTSSLKRVPQLGQVNF
jgi:hypothetical protein